MASIAETVILAGGEAGLRVAGANIPDVQPQSGRRHLDRILTMLAGIELEESRSAESPSIPALRSGVLVVVHVDRVDPRLGHDAAVHLLPASLDTLRKDPGDPPGEADSTMGGRVRSAGAVA